MSFKGENTPWKGILPPNSIRKCNFSSALVYCMSRKFCLYSDFFDKQYSYISRFLVKMMK